MVCQDVSSLLHSLTEIHLTFLASAGEVFQLSLKVLPKLPSHQTGYPQNPAYSPFTAEKNPPPKWKNHQNTCRESKALPAALKKEDFGKSDWNSDFSK